MVAKLTGTLSVRLHRVGNVLESLNTHHSTGMKYVDPNLIIYIIKSAQQFPRPCSTEQWGDAAQLNDRLKSYWCRAGTSFVWLICHSISTSSMHINGLLLARERGCAFQKMLGNGQKPVPCAFICLCFVYISWVWKIQCIFKYKMKEFQLMSPQKVLRIFTLSALFCSTDHRLA